MKKLLLIVLSSCALSAMQQNSKQNWDGRYHQKNSTPHYTAAVALLQTINLYKPKQIVDVGCGSGEVTARLSELAPDAEVMGIDPNETMISVAKQAYGHKPRLSFMVQDAQKEFPFKDQFDLAFSSAVFLWIADKKAAFNNVHQILKPGGRMVIKATMPLAQDHPLKITLNQLAKNPKWISLMHLWQSKPQFFPLSRTEAEQLITAEKWDAISMEEMTTGYQFKTKEELSKWMWGWMKALPVVSALPCHEQQSFLHDFSDEYVKIPTTQAHDGTILYTLKGLLIKAQKK